MPGPRDELTPERKAQQFLSVLSGMGVRSSLHSRRGQHTFEPHRPVQLGAVRLAFGKQRRPCGRPRRPAESPRRARRRIRSTRARGGADPPGGDDPEHEVGLGAGLIRRQAPQPSALGAASEEMGSPPQPRDPSLRRYPRDHADHRLPAGPRGSAVPQSNSDLQAFHQLAQVEQDRVCLGIRDWAEADPARARGVAG